jgi:molybdenum cofactor cytidylyltransferase
VPSVSVILLAAGASTRMGRQKALLLWHGTTLLAYQLAQLAAVDPVREIIVVTGHEPDRITAIVTAAPRSRAVHNAAYHTGKVSSIKAGLSAISAAADAIMLLAVDQPRPAVLLSAVVDAHFASGGLITVPTQGEHRGHPVIFDRSLLPELLAITEETQGIRAVMKAHVRDTHEVAVADPAVHLDLNSPADVEAAAAD